MESMRNSRRTVVGHLLEKIKENEEDNGRDWEIGTKASELKERKSEMKMNMNKESFLKTREAS